MGYGLWVELWGMGYGWWVMGGGLWVNRCGYGGYRLTVIYYKAV